MTEGGIVEINEDTKDLGDFVVTDTQVGETYWAKLYKVTSKSKNEAYMAKVLDLAKMDPKDVNHLKERTFKLIPFLVKNNNANIVGTYGIFLVNQNKLIIIEEVLSSTMDGVVKREGPFNEAKAKTYAKALGEAIAFLHDLGVAHQNVSMVNVYQNPRGALKLSAIEYATIYWDGENNELRLHKCVRKYKPGRHIAPEIISGAEYDPTKADSYSFGIFICCLLLAAYPYDSERTESKEEQWAKANQQLDQVLGDAGKEILMSLLKPEPSERTAVKDAIAHAWFSS